MGSVLPTQACKIVRIGTEKGMISIALSHLIHVEMEKGKILLAGYSYDIFASSDNGEN